MTVESTPSTWRPVAVVDDESDRGNVAPADRLSPPAISRLSPLVRLRQRPARVDEEAHIVESHTEGRLGNQAVTSGTARAQGPLAAQSDKSMAQLSPDSKHKTLSNKQAQDFFARIACTTPCVFLISGSREACRINQIQLKEDDDHVATLEKMKSFWEGSRVWLPFRKVPRVEEVRVCAIQEDRASVSLTSGLVLLSRG